MKKNKELNIDAIGGQGPLTKQEEKIISDFLKSRSTKKRRAIPRKKTTKRKSAV